VTVLPVLPVTVTASTTSTPYGTVPTVTCTLSGDTYGAPTGPATTPATIVTATTDTTSSPLVGANTCSHTLSDPRYTFSYVDGNASVTPIPIVITASSGTMPYGGTVPTITAGFSDGFVNGQDSSVLTTQPTCSTTATSHSNVGSYPSSCTGAAAVNYTFTYVNGAVTVTAVPLVITASSTSVTVGSAVPTITAGFSGFVNGDSSAVLTTLPTCSTTYTTSSTVAGSPYPSSCSGAADPNYTITYVPGTVTVTAVATAPVVVTPTTTTTVPAAAPTTAPAIAFTGAMLSDEWVAGSAAVLLGIGLVLVGRRRRRNPRHAANK
jgi:hypothetical protein